MMLSILAAISLTTLAPKSPSLEASFVNPPPAARPHTWWHWMGGNVTKEGITADLEAMKFAGIGGAHIFDAGQGIPDGPIAYNSPQWRELMAHAMKEAQRLGLDMTMHNCSGWSSSGGPWVKPDDAMKRIVYTVTETDKSDTTVAMAAPKPQGVDGYYTDIAIFVFPAPKDAPGSSDAVGSLTGLGGNPGPNPDVKWPVIRPVDPIYMKAAYFYDSRDVSNMGESTASEVKPGRYTVLRIGYTLTGTHNVASRPTGDGLEVDKLSSESLDNFLEGGLVPLFKTIGDPVGKAFKTVLIDSYETWFQNWTPKMQADFKRLRGYDPMPYLPALAGYAVKDVETTKKFLYDYRRTLTDLWAENYSGHFAKRIRKYGLQLAIEPYGNGSFDPFTYGKPAGLIMGEYWVGEGQINGSVKQAASVAHVYGHSVVGAESLTAVPSLAGWANQPRQWKPFADRGYATGINRIIYHRFTHQPWVSGVLPGMTMGPWGSHVDRTQTFWSFMPAWDQYLSRCQYMLQSGVYVADVCLYTGDGGPQQYTGEGYDLPEVPSGYNFDYCGRDPLMSLKVKAGRLVLPNGASYAVLALPNTDQMTVAVAKKIESLVKAGAVVYGPKPTKSPSLADGPKGDAEVARIGNALWSGGAGKGSVVSTGGLKSVLQSATTAPDFASEATRLQAIHRRIGGVDSYFLASMQPSPRTVTCTFRAVGRVPELWNPETGKIVDAPVWREGRKGTTVEIPLEADGSVFVVFRRSSTGVDHVTRVNCSPDAMPGPAPKKLTIIRAEYGQIGSAGKFVDVTDRLAAAVDDDRLRIAASNDAMGGDPAYQVIKALRVTYRLGDEEKTVTIPENEEFLVGDFPSAGTPPDYEIGGSTLDVWFSGGIDLTWSSGKTTKLDVEDLPEPVAVEGPWEVRFPAGWDAPEKTAFDQLISWTDHTEFGIKYFSGTATYSKTIQVPAELLGKGKRLFLDLGDVRECARVKLNGKAIASFWKPPFRVEITDVAKAGDNTLEVEVTNLWVNRLIGDEQFPDDMGWDGERLKGWPEWFVKGLPRPEPRRKTFTTWRRNTKDTPLMRSGLLGPVVLRPVKVIAIGE